jgi:hypothetical protein
MGHRVFTAAVLVTTIAGVAACGGGGAAPDNGVAAKSPDAIVSAATNAISGVKSVHVSGSLVSKGTPVSLDLNLVAGQGGAGRMSEGGLSFQLVALNQVVYVKGSDAFYQRFAGSAGAQLFHGKWLKTPATGQFGSLASLTNLQALFSALLSSHGTLATGGTSTVAGQKVVAVNDTTHHGTLYVAATGKPYPIEIVKLGADGGHILFDRYDESVSLSAPPNSIDVTKLK